MKSHKNRKKKGIKKAQDRLYDQRTKGSTKRKDSWHLSSAETKRTKRTKSTSSRDSDTKKSKSTEKKKKKSYVNVTLTFLLIGSLIFFAFSVITAAYMFFSGGVFVSSENITIEIKGNDVVSAGGEVGLNITVNNKNNVSLKNSEMKLRYPQEARDPENISSRIPVKRIEVGELQSGAVVEEKLSFNIFGKEGEQHTFSVSFEYNIEGSGAVFSKREDFVIKIKDTPISLDLSGPNEVYAGYVNEYEVVVMSHSDQVQESVIVKIDHPLNFNIIDSTEEIKRGVWFVKDLKPEEERTLKFNGVFTESLDGEKGRTLSVSAGPADDSVIHVAVSDVVVNIDARPFAFDLSFRDNPVSFGDRVEGELLWINRSGSQIKNARLELAFEGEAVESFSGGDASRVGNRLVWTGGDAFSASEGFVPFYFNTHLSEEIDERNINFRVLFVGETVDREEVSVEISKEVFVSTAFNMNVTTNLSEEDKDDLMKGEPVSFEMILSAVAGVDGVEDAEIFGVLPSFVFVKKVSARGEQIEFNKKGEFLWSLKDVESGTGVWGPERSVKLDVSVIPEEREETSVLIEEIVFTGKDEFDERSLRNTVYNITIEGYDVLDSIYGNSGL